MDRVPDPHTSFRHFFTWGLVGANALVFLSWQDLNIHTLDSIYHAQPTRDSNSNNKRSRFSLLRRQKFIKENFLLSQRNLRQGRWWTALTSAISHRDPVHLLTNMAALTTYARLALQHCGLSPYAVIMLTLGSAAAGSVATLTDWKRKGFGAGHSLQEGGGRYSRVEVAAHGASVMICGMGVAVTALRPWTRVVLVPLPVVLPLWVVTTGLLMWDYANVESATSCVGHACHLGGAAFGVLFLGC
ncbi:Uu.00g104240.m01.CDS01 [Anthostomella pinea]|uniref:Uu.00g104240.m01.CDS01 n=1 Tax=Anthostomella pinea TaxID=933095 RepID=A0AAI8YFT6_9PEZI|nr:Uu.00g104240.m01.CDS01 [Anthostomella pinea]